MQLFDKNLELLLCKGSLILQYSCIKTLFSNAAVDKRNTVRLGKKNQVITTY